jgi:hypothetical protein
VIKDDRKDLTNNEREKAMTKIEFQIVEIFGRVHSARLTKTNSRRHHWIPLREVCIVIGRLWSSQIRFEAIAHSTS